MQLQLNRLMDAILNDPDAAIDTGWSIRQWESIGFPALVRRRIQCVADLKVVLATLGSVVWLREIYEVDQEELIEWIS